MQGLANTTAVILAGGLGTRLRTVVSDRPKVLAEVAGRPFLSFLLAQLDASGVRHVVLCTGFLGDQVRAVFGETYAGLRLTYSREGEPLGTAGALRLALPLTESNPVLVMNGDSYCEADLQGFLTWHQTVGARAAVYLIETEDTGRYGRVLLDGDDRISRFEEKGQGTGPAWINTGIYFIDRLWLERIPEHRPVSLEREMFPAWTDGGLYGYRAGGRFLDIGIPSAYGSAESFFTGPAGTTRAQA